MLPALARLPAETSPCWGTVVTSHYLGSIGAVAVPAAAGFPAGSWQWLGNRFCMQHGLAAVAVNPTRHDMS